MRKRRRKQRRPRINPLYTHKPWSNGKCINPYCGSRMVAECISMPLLDGTRTDTFFCHDCGLALPKKIWKKHRGAEGYSLKELWYAPPKTKLRIQKELFKLEKELMPPRNPTEAARIYRMAHEIVPPPQVGGPARRVRLQGEVMAKTTKTTKKGKATKSMKSAKSAKVEKHTRTTQAGRGGVQDDPRLPEVGKIMTATYKGREIKVERVSDGFSYKKKVYRSLSKAAQVATKQPSVNGFLFFGLTGKKAAVKKVKKTKKAARRVKAD